LHRRHSTCRGPDCWPVTATAVTWSAVRSTAVCGDRCQPGHQLPCSRLHVATSRARRRRSLVVRVAKVGEAGRSRSLTAAHGGQRGAG
jgi:hypothetical protein